MPLEYEPRSRSIYSDLGFMLLGFVLEDVSPLHGQVEALRVQMQNPEELQFHPPALWKPRTAPTQHTEWHEPLLGGREHLGSWRRSGSG